MKKLLTILFILIAYVSYGQYTPKYSPPYAPMTAYGYLYKRLTADTTLHIPSFCGTPTLRSVGIKNSAIAFDTCNNRLYFYDGKTLAWGYISGSGWDSAYIYALANSKFNTVDTTGRWMPFGVLLDTTYFVDGTQDSVRAYIYTDGTVIYDTLGRSLLTSITNNITTILNLLDSARSDTTFHIVIDSAASGLTVTVVHDSLSYNDSIFYQLRRSSTTQGGYLHSTDFTIFNNKEPALGNPASNGYVLSSTTGGVRSWVAQSVGGSDSLDIPLAGTHTGKPVTGPIVITGATAASTPVDIFRINDTYSGDFITRFISDPDYVEFRIRSEIPSSGNATQISMEGTGMKFRTRDGGDSSYVATDIGGLFGSKYFEPPGDYYFVQKYYVDSAIATTVQIDSAEHTYAGTITWTGTTAPSGATAHIYDWHRTGNTVRLSIALIYATAGASLTQVDMTLPADCPTPATRTGLISADNIIIYGTGKLQTVASLTSVGTAAAVVTLSKNAANNGYEIRMAMGAGNFRYSNATIIYTAQ